VRDRVGTASKKSKLREMLVGVEQLVLEDGDIEAVAAGRQMLVFRVGLMAGG
jgi:hypothetical protein